MNRNFKENTQAIAVKAALGYLEKAPEKNFPKLLAWGDKFDVSNTLLAQRKAIHQVVDDPDSNWFGLIKSLWSDIDTDVRKRIFENFVINKV